MRHRYRSAPLDLFLKQRNNRTVRAQHITETRSDKLSDSLHFAILLRLIQTLHINFADTLGAPHHIGGIHRLVRRHHHKLLCPILHSQVCNDTRTLHIITHTLSRIILHHRHMLIRRRMKHIIGTIYTENLLHAFLHANITHDGFRLDVGPFARHHQTYIMQRRLRLIYQNKLLRSKFGNLAHYLASDAAGSSRYQNTLSGKQFLHRFQVDFYLVARQQIFNIHLLKLTMVKITLTVPLLRGRNHIDSYTCLYQPLHHFGIIPNRLILQGRNQQSMHSEVLHLLHQMLIVGINPLPHQKAALHILHIRNETAHNISGVNLVADTLRQSHSAGFHPIDKHTFSASSVKSRVIQIFHKNPHTPHHQNSQQCGNSDIPHTDCHQPTILIQQIPDAYNHQQARNHGKTHPLQIDKRRITNHPRIRVKHPKAHNIEQQIKAESPCQLYKVLQKRKCSVIQSINQHIRAQHYQAIQNEYTPIRQRVL